MGILKGMFVLLEMVFWSMHFFVPELAGLLKIPDYLKTGSYRGRRLLKNRVESEITKK